MITLIVHVTNADPIKLDVDELPSLQDSVIIGKNPRLRNDKDVDWIEDRVTTIMLPWWRITMIQVMPGENEEVDFPVFYRND